MIRTQVQLSEQQARALKQTAAAQGVSSAEIIRQALDLYLGNEPSEARRQRAIQAIGGHRSGRSDVSVRHDDDLSDAFAE